MTEASRAQGTERPVEVRVVRDVATLRVLSDPVRLAILRVLMADVDTGPRIMSVKELAEEIGQPPTNLYRHIKQLEAHNLITVAESRLVSGILEQRYRTSQLRLHWDSSLLADRTTSGDTSTMVAATFDQFRNDYVAGIRSGRILFGQDVPSERSYLSPILAMSDHRVPAVRASELRNRLAALIDEFVNAEQDDEGVPIRLMAAFFSPADRPIHGSRDTAAPSDSSNP
jgi:DNA-binding transcriptional ArsR family regulator